ncbi:MAG: hypothetical protein AAFQ94_02445 [Bacteroidota bacterium]
MCKWCSKQIVNSKYVERLLNENSDAIGTYNPLADGYDMLWSRSTRTFGVSPVSYLWASGNGGNHLVVIREKIW